MREPIPTKPPGKRRRFSSGFKAQIVAACDEPGTSVAGVALAHGLNANLVHKWRRLAKEEKREDRARAEFLPLPLARHPTTE